jgi:Ran GTPase-activating protein (RanGAP) involved in mRNA processing and transport
VLDLGQMVSSDSKRERGDYPTLVRLYEVQQVPPKTPQDFEALISGKKFTFECDRDVVITTYVKAFHALWGTSEKLSYVSASWGLNQMKELVGAIRALEKVPLRHLDLSRNNLDDECMAELAKVLSRCEQLQTLNVGHNAFGDVGAGALAQELTKCGLLKVLLMNNTSMTDLGLVALGKVLQKGKHVRRVDLTGTDCGKSGLEMFAKSVKECASLDYLRLTIKGSVDDQLKKLKDAWKEAGKPEYRLHLDS